MASSPFVVVTLERGMLKDVVSCFFSPWLFCVLLNFFPKLSGRKREGGTESGVRFSTWHWVLRSTVKELVKKFSSRWFGVYDV